jgi:hypothetical protein
MGPEMLIKKHHNKYLLFLYADTQTLGIFNMAGYSVLLLIELFYLISFSQIIALSLRVI